MRNKRKMGYVFLMSLLILCCSSTTVFAADTSAEYVPQLYATIWSLVPPVVAIVLALITKEVYSSLFVGILIGGVFWSGFKPEATILHVFQDGSSRSSYRFLQYGYSSISGNSWCYGMYDE